MNTPPSQPRLLRFEDPELRREYERLRDPPGPPSAVTQAMLRLDAALAEAAEARRELRRQILRACTERDAIEPGDLTAQVTMTRTRSFGRRTVESVLGRDRFADLWSRLPESTSRRLTIGPSMNFGLLSPSDGEPDEDLPELDLFEARPRRRPLF